MSRFDECLAFVLAREGGYVNDKADRGGATNKGITQAVYDEWRTLHSLCRQPVIGISGDEVESIYRTGYWVEGLPEPLDLVVFDSAVQHGTVRAIKFLQTVVGTTIDGRLGPQTHAALEEATSELGVGILVRDYLRCRDELYDDIIKNNPSQSKFQRGWANRMNALRNACNALD